MLKTERFKEFSIVLKQHFYAFPLSSGSPILTIENNGFYGQQPEIERWDYPKNGGLCKNNR